MATKKRSSAKRRGPTLKAAKPPFRPALMSDILSVPRHGLKAISTFSGCGGSCLGLRWAGWEILWASEFVQSARDTYRMNSDTFVDGRDIRQVTVEHLLEKNNLKVGELDLLEGSPPCAAFSTNGVREAGWQKQKDYSERKQRVDDLFGEYVRLIEGLMPRAFIAENVVGLTQGVAKGYLKEIMRDMTSAGYVVQARVLDAQYLNVPQSRRRLIFVGLRRDVAGSDLKPAVYPSPKPYTYNILDACPWFAGAGRPEDADEALWRAQPTAEELAECALPPGQAVTRKAAGLKFGEQHEKQFNLRRLDPSKPAYTILQSDGKPGISSIVVDGTRKPAIPEIRRLCGFPDDFILQGTFQQRWERLGRAVPPPMMKAVGESLAEYLLAK